MLRSTARKVLTKFVIFCFIFQAIFSMTFITTSAAVSDDILTLDVTARNITANQGVGNYRVLAYDNSEIIIEYKIEGKPFEIRPNDKKTEIALVLDVSSSMNEVPQGASTTKLKIEELKDATKSFIEKFKDRNDVFITIVPFSRYSNPEEYFSSLVYRSPSALTEDEFNAAKNEAIRGAGMFLSPNDAEGYARLNAQAKILAHSPGTNIGDGLRMAYYKLKTSPYHDNSNKYIVLMTDGAATNATIDFSINTPGFDLATLYRTNREEFNNSVMKGSEPVTKENYSIHIADRGDPSNEYAKIIGAMIKNDSLLNITPFYVAYDQRERSSFASIANALGIPTNDVILANSDTGTDLMEAFNEIVGQIPTPLGRTIPLTVDFKSELPFGININHILGRELEVGQYQASINSNDITIKVGDAPVTNFIVDVEKKANGSEGPSSVITGKIGMSLTNVSGNIYKPDDVIINIKVKLTKPERSDLVQIPRTNSELNYRIPDPTQPSGSSGDKKVNANNNVVLSIVSVDDSLLGTKKFINPSISPASVDVAKNVEIEYDLTGTVSLTVPSFPPTPTPTVTPVPTITPTATPTTTPASPTKKPKEIFFLIDSSMDLRLGKTIISPALNYVLYSLNNLKVEGMNKTINGSIYANNHFYSSASEFQVVGGTIECGSSEITGPDTVVNHLKSLLKDAAQTISFEDLEIWQQIQNEAYEVQANARGITLSPNVSVRVENIGGKNIYTIYGDGTFYLNRDYYFDGDLIVSLNHIIGDGESFILAEGDIIFQGQAAANKTYERISLFSKKGNIKFESSNSIVTGLAFAPEGQIVFQGQENKFEGNFIGGDIVVNSEDSVFSKPTNFDNNDVVDDYWAQHPHYETLVRALRGLIGLYNEHKIGVIQYTSSASSEFNNFKLYDMKDDSQKEALDKYIEENIMSNSTEKSNLGDALRRAYLSFEDRSISDPGASKYIIIMSGKEPNIYSADDPVNPPLVGDASNLVEDADRAVEYAESYASKLSTNTKALFVDLTKFTNEPNDALKRVALAAGIDLSTGFLTADYRENEKNAYECIDDVFKNNPNSVRNFIDQEEEEIIEPETTIPDAGPSPSPEATPVPSPEITEPKISTINIIDTSFYFTETLPSGVIPKSVNYNGNTYEFITSGDTKYFEYTFEYGGESITRRWTATYNNSLNAYIISGYIPCRLIQISPDDKTRTYEVVDPNTDNSPKFSVVVGFDQKAIINELTRDKFNFTKIFNFAKGYYTFDVIDPEQILSNCNPITGEFSPELEVTVRDAIDVN